MYWVTENLHDELSWKYSDNLLLNVVNCHLFFSTDENTFKVNSIGGLCCILASCPCFFIFNFCVPSLCILANSCHQHKTHKSFHPWYKTVIKSGPQGKTRVLRLGLWYSVDGNKLLCCLAACQARNIREGKWRINWYQLPEQSRDHTATHGSNGEDGFAWEKIPANKQTCETQLQYLTDCQCFLL